VTTTDLMIVCATAITISIVIAAVLLDRNR